jgi:hypothetical protein
MSPPLDPLACAVFVVLAFLPAGLVHSLWLHSRWAERWRIPIDGGRTWRNARLFGDNKTWAGFLVLPPMTGLTFAGLRLGVETMCWEWCNGLWSLSVGGYALLGCWTGVGFMAGELPTDSSIEKDTIMRPGETLQLR